MNKKYLLIFSVILLAINLTGCWDRRELNDLAISVGMGFDKKGKKVQVTTQIVNPSEVASKKGSVGYTTPVTTLSAAELSTFEAIRKISTVSPRRIFSSHLRILVIGEALARKGVSKILDGISRNYEMRSDFYLIIAKGTTAENVLKILTPIEKIPANKLFSTLETSQKAWAPTVKIQLDEFMSDLSDPTKDNVLTGIKIIGNEEIGGTLRNTQSTLPDAVLQYSGLAILKNDKLVDWFNQEESKGYNYIMGDVTNTVGHITCPKGGIMAVEVIRTKSKISGMVVNGKPKISVDLQVEENIGEVQCEIDLTKPENIKRIEDLGSKKVASIVEASIKKAKKNKADIFGFGDAIENAAPKDWVRMKKNWANEFAELDIKVNVDLKIRRLGTINNSILERPE